MFYALRLVRGKGSDSGGLFFFLGGGGLRWKISFAKLGTITA